MITYWWNCLYLHITFSDVFFFIFIFISHLSDFKITLCHCTHPAIQSFFFSFSLWLYFCFHVFTLLKLIIHQPVFTMHQVLRLYFLRSKSLLFVNFFGGMYSSSSCCGGNVLNFKLSLSSAYFPFLKLLVYDCTLSLFFCKFFHS